LNSKRSYELEVALRQRYEANKHIFRDCNVIENGFDFRLRAFLVGEGYLKCLFDFRLQRLEFLFVELFLFQNQHNDFEPV